MDRAQKRSIKIGLGLGLLIIPSLPFAVWALSSGVAGLFQPQLTEDRFFVAGQTIGNHAIYGHMVLGAVLMFLSPLQLWSGLRVRFPAVHRWTGRLLCFCAVLTGAGGLAYIMLRGTIGGVWMDAGFGLYGGLVVLSGVQVIRYARMRQFERHRRWALRLFVLSFASWLYRLHYGLWYLITDGAASTPDFDGSFDLVQNVAFYLPYLVLLEFWMRRRTVPVSV